MTRIFADNSLAIGGTPLVRLNKVVAATGGNVYGKIEGRNPAYSVKCRIGAAMINDAIERGVLKPGMEIVEPTSGNTGIALAFVAAAKGIKLTLTMPETMSIERRKILKVLGAEVLLTSSSKGMSGAVAEAERLANEFPERYILLNQFRNPANPEAHFKTTGPEVWDDTDGQVDVVIAGVGTGGTISGIAKYIKHAKGKDITVVAVEPEDSPVISQHLADEMLQPGPHKIQGIGAGFLPETLDLDLIDRVETVSNDDAYLFARRLAREEGILAGISCGAATAVAARLIALPEFADKNIVVILPDSGERYLSSDLYSDIVS